MKDQKTFELLQRGETTAIFQLESKGMRDYLKQLIPNDFEDIVSMNALYRPGALGNEYGRFLYKPKAWKGRSYLRS